MDPDIAAALEAITQRSDRLEAANVLLAASNTTLQQQVAALQNAPGPAGGLDPLALGAAIAANLPMPNVDHSRVIEKMDTFDGEDSKLPVEDFLKNLEARFAARHTPDNLRCGLVVEKFKGKALSRFKAFTNAAGLTGDRASTTWTEFKAWMLVALAPDAAVESAKIERAYLALEQKASAEKFADAYREVVARIANNPESSQLHTPASLIRGFVTKLKPGVRIFLVKERFTTLEAAIASAILHDNIVFESAKSSNPPKRATGGGSGSPSPHLSPYGSRNPSPGPAFGQHQVAAMLAAMGYSWDGTQATLPGSPSPTLAAMEKDHSVAPGQPVPKLTDEIRAWCMKHRACFRCRQKDARHLGKDCPRYKGVPNARGFGAIEEVADEDVGQGNEESSGRG
jgi:hypothetical protein